MRVGIIGLGMVGKEVLLNLFHFSQASEILVCDLNKDRAIAEIADLEDTKAIFSAQHYKKITVVDGYSGLTQCDIVIINVSVKIDLVTRVQDRTAMIAENEALIAQIAPEVAKYSPKACVVITGNPVDSIARFFAQYSHMDPHRVIGSGTLLDSARLIFRLAQHYHVAETSITAWVLGEHGKTSFIPWSLARIAGMPLETFERITGITPIDRAETLQYVLNRGFSISKVRNCTDHGIGASVLHICQAIVQDRHVILPVSCPFTGEYQISDVNMSALAIVGAAGIEKVLEVPLENAELAAYKASADFLKDTLNSVKSKH